jgi:hypothetical protein
MLLKVVDSATTCLRVEAPVGRNHGALGYHQQHTTGHELEASFHVPEARHYLCVVPQITLLSKQLFLSSAVLNRWHGILNL